jgi:hypothetical protein
MAYEVILRRPGLYRILLEECKEGVYVNAFATEDAPGPFHDTLQDDLAMAQRACREDYGVNESEWRLVADEQWHGES